MGWIIYYAPANEETPHQKKGAAHDGVPALDCGLRRLEFHDATVIGERKAALGHLEHRRGDERFQVVPLERARGAGGARASP